MSFRSRKRDSRAAYWIAGLLVAAFVVVIAARLPVTAAQAPQTGIYEQPKGNAALVARGKYIVEDVAMCGTCHTPRKADGQLDYSRWLAGAPVPYVSSRPVSDWPQIAPRLAGLPPTSDAGMITLLTTAVWTDGKQLRDPMPKFHMTREDAQAVLAYLKSL
ncbi:MAG TPA: c-type cytochrome [Terriglobales bacterium]|nr:c-type cytochrome [Terriglobales bacterium]